MFKPKAEINVGDTVMIVKVMDNEEGKYSRGRSLILLMKERIGKIVKVFDIHPGSVTGRMIYTIDEHNQDLYIYREEFILVGGGNA